MSTTRLPLGTFVHARSGDKGGNANIGLWVRQDPTGSEDPVRRSARIDWLVGFITLDRVRGLLPETSELPVAVHPLANLGGVNVIVEGLLGEGVASSTRFDPQAKALGEWIRSRLVDIPDELLDPV